MSIGDVSITPPEPVPSELFKDNDEHHQKRALTEDERTIIFHRLTVEKKPYTQVAKELGRSKSVVIRAAQRMGIRSSLMPGHNNETHSRPRITLTPGVARSNGASSKNTSAAPVKTSDVPKRNGFYRCPDLVDGRKCPAKYTELRHLGRHRATHGVVGISRSAKMARASRRESSDLIDGKLYRNVDGGFHCPECGHVVTSDQGIRYHLLTEHGISNLRFSIKRNPNSTSPIKGESTNGNSGQNSAQSLTTTQVFPPNPAPSNGKRTRNPWTPEARAGLVFASVYTDITTASEGDTDVRAHIAQRISEFLSYEVSGQSPRGGPLRPHGNLPPLRDKA
jgi:hypothetical protein